VLPVAPGAAVPVPRTASAAQPFFEKYGEKFEPLSDDGKAVLTHEWRKIINGLDHAEEAAKKFEQILRARVNKKLSSRRNWQAYVYFRARTFN